MAKGNAAASEGGNPKTDPKDVSNQIKDPDEWTTGGEPMTGAQASYLKTLSEEAKEPEAFDESPRVLGDRGEIDQTRALFRTSFQAIHRFACLARYRRGGQRRNFLDPVGTVAAPVAGFRDDDIAFHTVGTPLPSEG